MRFLVFIFCLISFQAQAQTYDEWKQQYDKNIKREYLNDVYIPVDLEDAMKELMAISDPAGISKFKSADEEEISRGLHFGLGRWMMLNWNLYDGSRYSHYLKEIGVTHPDDMVQFTIVSLHRNLNGIDLQTTERAEKYRVMRKKLQEERNANKAPRG